jgi:hypothetical protein
MALLCKVTIMTKCSDSQAKMKREKIQFHFWNQVGFLEHISLPMLETAIRKEFNCTDDRIIKAQIKLMQTEGKIGVQSKVKVWIKTPRNDKTI